MLNLVTTGILVATTIILYKDKVQQSEELKLYREKSFHKIKPVFILLKLRTGFIYKSGN